MKVASASSNGYRGCQSLLHKKFRTTYSIFFFAGQLTRGLKVDSEVGEVTFVVLASIFYRVNMKGNSKAMDWKHDSLRFAVNEDLRPSLSKTN
jgi:hypothetical protein